MSQPPSAPGPQGPDYGQQPPKKSRKKWAIGCLGLFVLALLLFGGCAALMGGGGDTADPGTSPEATTSAPGEESPEAEPTTVQTEAPEEPEAPEAEQDAEQSGMTTAQQNAIRSAENYIAISPFSRTGLIEQLEFEGYSTEDATFAVDSLDIDYNAQAAKAAENYLEISAFSRSGLIEQLVFEGYTQEQATYGVDQTGL